MMALAPFDKLMPVFDRRMDSSMLECCLSVISNILWIVVKRCNMANTMPYTMVGHGIGYHYTKRHPKRLSFGAYVADAMDVSLQNVEVL